MMSKSLTIALLLSTLAVALSSATNGPVTINPAPGQTFTISEGFSKVFEFKLDEPIICPQQANKECNVIIRLTNTHPHEITMDNCHVKWRWDQWTESRFITVRAVEDFVDDGEKVFQVLIEPIESPSEYYNEFDLPDWTFKTSPRPSSVCRATGDPHYTTFDGQAYHVYAPGRVVFYKSLVRDFEVQTDMYSFSRPAVHCAIAARENNDIVVISLCATGSTVNYRRSCGSAECKRGSFPKVGITGSSNPSYVIEFASGAKVTASVNYWSAIGRKYLNIYVTAPGVDRDNTVGMCGNNNGNRNDDTSACYNCWINDFASLYESQRPKTDLFSFYPSPVTVTPTLPPFAEECDYMDPPFVRPILNNPDVEDITNLLRSTDRNNETNAEGLEFDASVIENIPDEWSREDATQACGAVREHDITKACLEVFPDFNLDGFIDQCVEDLIETGGDPDFFEVTINALKDQCGDLGNRDLNTWEVDENLQTIEPNMELQNTLCPNECSGNGVCSHTKCECNEGFIGIDCSIGEGVIPKVESVEPAVCDSRGVVGCPSEVSIFGENFWDSDGLSCRFGDIVSQASLVSFSEVRCVVPESVKQSGADVIIKAVQVTTNGADWSQEAVTFTWYDAICNICSKDGCTENADACTVDGVCLIEGQQSSDNVCLVCAPGTSANSFSFDTVNSNDCGPRFSASVYTAEIVGSGTAGDVLTTVNAMNKLVSEDPSNALTYTFSTSDHIFVVDANGVVSLSEDLIVTDALLHNSEFASLVYIIATDAYGRSDEAALFVTLLTTNSRPLFEKEEYDFTVPEDVETGYEVGTVTASDADNAEGDWGSIVYSWSMVDAGDADIFQVNQVTGVITVKAPLNFEKKSSYKLQLSARDGGGQYHLTSIVINLEDVNEAPTMIGLSKTSVAENAPAGTIVGVITVEDEDAEDTHTVKISPASTDFAIVGSELRTQRPFDFENENEKSFTVTIVATDAQGASLSKEFTILVTNVNEAPTNIRIVENDGNVIVVSESLEQNRIIADITVDDVDSEVVGCTLTKSDSHHFVMQNNRIILVESLNFEMDSEHMLTVMCADDAGAQSEAFDIVVKVTDAEEGPQNIKFILSSNGRVPENTEIGTEVGVVVAEDEDATATSIVFEIQTENPSVSLGETTCDTSTSPLVCTAPVVVAAALNFESNNGVYAFVVRATDETAMFDEEEVYVPLSDSNDAPTGIQWVNGGMVTEDAEPGTEVGRIFVLDEDAGQLFTITIDSDIFEVQQNARRSVDSATFAGVIVVKDSSSLRAGNDQVISLTVTDDSDSPIVATFDITVKVEAEPLKIRFSDGTHYASVDENSRVNTKVDTFVVTGLPKHGVAVITITPRGAGVHTPFVLRGNSLVVSDVVDYEAYQAYLIDVNVNVVDNHGDPIEGFEQSITDERFTVMINDVDEDVVFTDAVDTALVNSDISNAVVAKFSARDPERLHVVYSIVSDETEGLVSISQSGNLLIVSRPSLSDLSLGDYVVVIGASVTGSEPVTHAITLTIHDDCYEQTCAGNGRCVDAFRRFTCDCADGFTGENCENFLSTVVSSTFTDENGNVINSNGLSLSSQNASASISATSIVGIVVGAIVLIVLIALLVFLVMRKKENKELEDIYGEYQQRVVGGVQNPTFVGDCQPLYETAPDFTPGVSNPMYGSYTTDFTPGFANPLYAWYQPEYTREQTSSELQYAPVGSFIVRDSSSTHGWHMLGVKTASGVIHEKIRQTPNGFELMSSSVAKQPEFPDVPSLVGYYSTMLTDVGFTLAVSAVDNPMYAEASRGMWTKDAAAPAVPLKDAQKDSVRQFLDSEDFYANTEDAKRALNNETRT
eukprot:m.49500 g.49500  ORF g.49500 m.49500 type:complete len:1837 (-) comp7454_c0_seq3:541-6051(-)